MVMKLSLSVYGFFAARDGFMIILSNIISMAPLPEKFGMNTGLWYAKRDYLLFGALISKIARSAINTGR